MRFTDREQIIKKYIINKDILDIGCVSNQKEGAFRFGRLHRFLVKHSNKVKGMDIDKEGIKALKKKNYDIVYGDAETFKLKHKFEVIVAGELIEHLSNQGLFLDSCNAHLKKDGLLIITTPNPYFFLKTVTDFVNMLKINEQHTLLHHEITLRQILERHGFKVKGVFYTNNKTETLKGRIFRFFSSI